MDSATFRSPTQRYGTLAKHKRPSKILPARAFVGGNGDGQIGYAHSHGLEQAYIAPCGRFYIPGNDIRHDRSEERCVGKECVRPVRYRWSPCHTKKKK